MQISLGKINVMLPQSLIPDDPSILTQFLLAAGVALAAAAPIGAISILAIQRAMSLGFKRAFYPTLGAITGNGIFGVIAALGSGYLSTSIIGSKVWLRLIGSIILVVMGLRLYAHHQMDETDPREDFGQTQLGILNFILVLSNPLTLGFYLAAFAMLGLKSPHLFSGQSVTLGGGIVFGALIWFTFICTLAGRFHRRVSELLLIRVRRGVGILLVILGMAAAARVLIGG